MNFYEGKNAIITGGSSGIGLAMAEELIGQGCDVTILSRTKETLDNALRSLQSKTIYKEQQVHSIQADVTDRTEIQERLSEFVSFSGTPDIVVNCAGVAHPGTFSGLKIEIFDWMMRVNYFGTVNVLKALVPYMQKNRSGSIVNLSSVAGFIGVYGYTAYGASKYAVAGFSDALRAELKPYGIHVSIVFPPDTQTPQLDYEKKFKPFITQQIAGSAKLMTSHAVAQDIVKNVARRKYLILPGTESKLLYFGNHFLGGALYPVMDWMVKSAINKIKFG